MPIQRIVKCDTCGFEEKEKVFGEGWKGWAIINGIAAVQPRVNEPLTEANMKTHMCPKCSEDISKMISTLQKLNGMPT